VTSLDWKSRAAAGFGRTAQDRHPEFIAAVLMFNQAETIANDPKILTKLPGRFCVVSSEARPMTEHQLREQEFQIARYRRLEREVTDPLAACLLHSIIEELEAELRRDQPDLHGPRD
jgi:hypothetical protein